MSEDTRVLIVDHGRFSALISKMLVGKFATETAEDGLQAIKALRTTPPNILIVDQDIPGNGIRLAELVGMSPKYKDVSVVLTSGKPSPDTIIRAKNAGVSSYLAKPFRPSEPRESNRGARYSIKQPLLATATSESASGEDGKEDAAASAAGGEGTEDDEGAEEESGSAGDIRSKVKNIDGLPSIPGHSRGNHEAVPRATNLRAKTWQRRFSWTPVFWRPSSSWPIPPTTGLARRPIPFSWPSPGWGWRRSAIS